MEDRFKRSTDATFPSAKRVKQEPEETSDEDRLYEDSVGNDSSNDHLIESNDSLEKLKLPNTIDKLLSVLLDHNIFTDSEENAYISRCKDLSRRQSFEKPEHYQVSFLPYIMIKILRRLNTLSKSLAVPQRWYSILIKIVEKGEFIEYKCISTRLYDEDQRPQGGEFLAVNCVYKGKDNEEAISDQTYYGYVLHSQTRRFDPQHQIENTLRNNLLADERGKYLVHEVIFKMKYIKDLHSRNDYCLLLRPFGSIHSLIMQARTIIKIKDNPVVSDLIDPKSSIAPSSITIEPESPLTPNRLDTVSKAIDLVGQNKPTSSKILCLDIASHELRCNLTIEIIRQVHRNLDYFVYDDKDCKPCVLILSENAKVLEKLYNSLNKDERFMGKIVYLGSSFEDNQVKQLTLQEYKRDFENFSKKIIEGNGIGQDLKSIQGYIDFLEGKKAMGDLDFSRIVELHSRQASIIKQLLSTSFVALASLKELTQSLKFYSRSAKSKILCSIIDDACDYDEPEIISLTSFGVNKFILMSEVKERPNQGNIFEPFALDRPLFDRFVKCVSNQQTSPNSSFVRVT